MKFFCLLLCLFIAHPGIAQDDDDDKMLEQLQKDKKAQARTYQRIHQSTEIIRKAPLNVIEEMRKSGHAAVNLEMLMDPKMVKLLQKAYRDGKFHEIPLPVMKKLLMEKVRGQSLERLFDLFPKSLDITAEIMIDREALPRLLGIFPQKDQLQFFGMLCFCLFVFGIVFKKIISSRNAGRFRRLMTSLGVSLMVSAGTVAIFCFLFERELAPSLRIVGRYLSI